MKNGVRRKHSQGFSLLEMVIAIFIIAVVLSFSLILMSKGLGTSARAGEVAIATIIAQSEMEKIKDIPFPPTTVDRQSEYPSSPSSWEEPVETPYKNDFEVLREAVGYDNQFQFETEPDKIMLRRVEVSVRRKRDGAILVKFHTYITRNGAI